MALYAVTIIMGTIQIANPTSWSFLIYWPIEIKYSSAVIVGIC